MNDSIVFVDTETTGLDPDRHEIWEVALIWREQSDTWSWAIWQLPVDLGRADPVALNISGFHERYGSHIADLQAFASRFAELTRGKHLVGAVPSFDEERLRKLLRTHGACPEWHYHLVDVEAMAAGLLGVPPPWDSENLSRWVGVDPDEIERHTALGDARWAKAVYEAVMKGQTAIERGSTCSKEQ